MPSIDMPATIDAKGNISVHAQGGAWLTIESSQGVDFATRAIQFRTSHGLSKALESVDGGKAKLVLTKDEVAGIPSQGAAFSFVDTVASPEYVFWEGLVRRRGFTS